MNDWAMRVYQKSCESMADIPSGSVQTCVTSPPYYGLRDYGTGTWAGGDPACGHIAEKQSLNLGFNARSGNAEGEKKQEQTQVKQFAKLCETCGATRVDEQIGLEDTLEEYVDRLVGVFREVRRVLRDDGTLWLNLGDSYASSGVGTFNGGGPALVGRNLEGHKSPNLNKAIAAGLKPKDLIGVPWAVAFALRADGWWLRDAIVWAKPSCMPSSVTDRCTPSYEMVFMLAKSARYFSDMDAIREPLTQSTLDRVGQKTYASQFGSDSGNGGEKRNGPMHAVTRGKSSSWLPHGDDLVKGNGTAPGYTRVANEAGANKRNVWTIASEPYSEAHFATFPRELPSICIRAGTSEAGCCSACGASRVRVTSVAYDNPGNRTTNGPRSLDNREITQGAEVRLERRTSTLRFDASCACDAPTVGSIVLDPFMGSGTVAEVAESLGRRWVGYELSAEYHELIKQRTRQRGLFTGETA